MNRRWPAIAGSLLCFGLLLAPLGAEEPPHVSYAPVPPGTMAQNQLVYLAGDAMHSQWRAVASKQLIGQGNGSSFYQWYLSIYALDGTTYRLKYQSPANGGPLSKVTHASGGAKMWFPVQTLQIAGIGEFERAGVQQLVVSSHEMAADCGSAIVTILASGANGAVVPAVSVRNGCELKATIAHAKTPARATRSCSPVRTTTRPRRCAARRNRRRRQCLVIATARGRKPLSTTRSTPANSHRNIETNRGELSFQYVGPSLLWLHFRSLRVGVRVP